MIFRIVTIIGLCLFCNAIFAQVTSNSGRFTLPDEKACAPYGSNNEIVVNVPECNGSLSCAIDFNYEPGQPFGTDPAGEDNVEVVLDGVPVAYNYTQPGTYFVAILFGAGTGDIDYATFTVLPNNPPDFNIYTCSNNAVQIDILDNTRDDFTVDYDGDNVVDEITQTGLAPYPRSYGAGTTQAAITIRPNYRNCVSNTKQAALIPGIISSTQLINRLEVTDVNEINLSFTNTQPNVLYQLERSENGLAAFSEITKSINNNSFVDLNTDPDQNYYCYRLGAVDICSTPTPTYTNIICSVSSKLVVGNGEINVSWKTNTSVANNLTMLRNNTPIDPGLTPSGTYNDKDITCGTPYCYQFLMRYGNIESVSKTLCGTAKSTKPPPPIEEITTIVDQNSVLVEWAPLANYTISKYDIFKLPENFLVEATVTTPTFTDEKYNTAADNCYLVRFDDVCKNRSAPSTQVCALSLTATLDQANNSVHLTWQAYTGYAAGIARYIIEKYDENGNKIADFDVQQQTSYVDDSDAPGQAFTYVVKAYSNSATVTNPSVSNTQSVIKSPRLWNPTAFLPEGQDTRNQTFSVKGDPEYITAYELRIFNRWGEMVFVSTDMEQGWDGRFKGVKMPEGTYVFRTKVTDTAGRTFDYSGTVVLFRKQ